MRQFARAVCLLGLVAVCTAHIGIVGTVPTMRLRGGGLFGARGDSESMMQQAAQNPVGPAEPPQQPQINLATHAVEYALAGSFDGIRSGVGQAVGAQTASWVGQALGKAGRTVGFFVMTFLGSVPIVRRVTTKQVAAPRKSSSGIPAMQATGVCVCFVTVPSDEVADVITTMLVSTGLAACVNQVPGITSTYVWQGKLQKDSESLLIIKTNREQLADVAIVVKEKHPFECPEFICMDVGAGLPDYLNWVRSTAHGSGSGPM